jgi:hypothetical protein
MWTPNWAIGYHGCDRQVAEAVLSGETTLKASTNDYDWLGMGVYFWENDSRRALDWAEMPSRSGPFVSSMINEPWLIGAVIELGNCLDLLEAESIRHVQEAYDELRETFATVGAPMPVNSGGAPDRGIRRLDCAVINYLHEAREAKGHRSFDSVRAAFVEGKPLYQGAGFHSRTHVQLCVRSEAQIVGYFRVREGKPIGKRV